MRRTEDSVDGRRRGTWRHPDRDHSRIMEPEVTTRISESISRVASTFTLGWEGSTVGYTREESPGSQNNHLDRVSDVVFSSSRVRPFDPQQCRFISYLNFGEHSTLQTRTSRDDDSARSAKRRFEQARAGSLLLLQLLDRTSRVSS